MKAFRLGLVVMAAALFSLALGAPAMAFHDDGVARCAGCHTMHNSQDGDVVTDTPGENLLKASDASSACLECHAGYGQATTDGSGYGSGGDFYWLTKTYTWEAHGHAYASEGDSHGHNIIAADYGMPNADAILGTVAPGGDDVGDLSCASCHDPHGKGEGVLLLWGSEKASFSADAPILDSPGRSTASYNAVSDDNHTAFGSGASAWCANCHADMADDTDESMHPVDRGLGTTMAGNYGDYVSTNVLTGDPATSYWEAVPFETNQALVDLDTASTAGPTSTSKVMCMTCHRAHASAFPDAGRWDFSASFLVEDSHPQAGDGNAMSWDVANKYYDRDYVAGEDEFAQRSLCNKCHKQDSPDT